MTTPGTPPEDLVAEAPATSLQPPNWLDQDELLRDLWTRNETPEQIATQLGRSVAAIMTRAARLGLPRRAAPGRKPGYQRKQTIQKTRSVMREGASAMASHSRNTNGEDRVTSGMPMVRICLMCLNKFPSEGRHNRICSNCKGSAEYNAGSSIPDMFKVEA